MAPKKQYTREELGARAELRRILPAKVREYAGFSLVQIREMGSIDVYTFVHNYLKRKPIAAVLDHEYISNEISKEVKKQNANLSRTATKTAGKAIINSLAQPVGKLYANERNLEHRIKNLEASINDLEADKKKIRREYKEDVADYKRANPADYSDAVGGAQVPEEYHNVRDKKLEQVDAEQLPMLDELKILKKQLKDIRTELGRIKIKELKADVKEGLKNAKKGLRKAKKVIGETISYGYDKLKKLKLDKTSNNSSTTTLSTEHKRRTRSRSNSGSGKS